GREASSLVLHGRVAFELPDTTGLGLLPSHRHTSTPSASRPSIIRQPRDVTGAAAGPSSDPRSRRAPSRWRASGGEPHSRMRTREACERVWFQIGARRANKTVAPPPL